MPQKAQGPKGVVCGWAFGKVGEISIHGGEESLGETGTLGERNAGRERGRDDPPNESEDEDAKVKFVRDTFRDFKLHTGGGVGCGIRGGREGDARASKGGADC